MTHEISRAVHLTLEQSGEIERRERVVWTAIGRYTAQYRQAPTSSELMQFLGEDDPNRTRPRLTEMRDRGCVEACGVRRCSVKHTVQQTWRQVTRRPPWLVPHRKPKASERAVADAAVLF